QASGTDWPAPYDTVLPVTDGPHYLWVYARDNAGNEKVTSFIFYTGDKPTDDLFGLIIGILGPVVGLVVTGAPFVYLIYIKKFRYRDIYEMYDKFYKGDQKEAINLILEKFPDKSYAEIENILRKGGKIS
ncbi:MAG: hypothetical protein ACFFD4_34475, partial [Candidatus Odinarchaeota archaeon]